MEEERTCMQELRDSIRITIGLVRRHGRNTVYMTQLEGLLHTRNLYASAEEAPTWTLKIDGYTCVFHDLNMAQVWIDECDLDPPEIGTMTGCELGRLPAPQDMYY